MISWDSVCIIVGSWEAQALSNSAHALNIEVFTIFGIPLLFINLT